MYVECKLVGNGGMLLCEPLRTRYRPMKRLHSWDELLTFPVKMCEMPLDTKLCITVWDSYSPMHKTAIGGVTLPILSPTGEVPMGKYQARLWSHREASLPHVECPTPGKLTILDDFVRIENVSCHHHRRCRCYCCKWRRSMPLTFLGLVFGY